MLNVGINSLSLEEIRLILLKKKPKKATPILPKFVMKLILSKWSSFIFNNIFGLFGGRIFQQTVGIPLDTHCFPLFVDLFLYSYEADVI
jgi:hypothetical protein